MPRPVDVSDAPAQSILPDGTIALPPTMNPVAPGLGSNSQQRKLGDASSAFIVRTWTDILSS